MSDEKILSILMELSNIGDDDSVPRNVRLHIKKAILALEEEGKIVEVKIDRALEELSDVDTDPNLQQYIRTRIWNVVSALEGR